MNANCHRIVCFGVIAGLAGVLFTLAGVSCPPPRNPTVIQVIPDSDTDADTPLPQCIDGFVCINFTNQASIPAQLALYRHNGFDPDDEFADTPSFECCTNPNSVTACICECPGKETGDCLLDRTEIFVDANLDTISGANSVTLAPDSSVLKRVRCEEAKTLGAAVAGIDGDPIMEPVDQFGPAYRDESIGAATFTCGGTIQFAAEDINEVEGGGEGAEELAALFILVDTEP